MIEPPSKKPRTSPASEPKEKGDEEMLSEEERDEEEEEDGEEETGETDDELRDTNYEPPNEEEEEEEFLDSAEDETGQPEMTTKYNIPASATISSSTKTNSISAVNKFPIKAPSTIGQPNMSSHFTSVVGPHSKISKVKDKDKNKKNTDLLPRRTSGRRRKQYIPPQASFSDTGKVKTTLDFFRELKCTECNKDFDNTAKLKKHMGKYAEEWPYFCVDCQLQLQEPIKFRKHMNQHHQQDIETQNLKCEVCNTETPNARFTCVYSRHRSYCRSRVKREESEGIYCKDCDKYYRMSKKGFEIHVKRRHTDEEPDLECEICDYRCWDRTVLTSHMVVHSDERTEQCDVCGKWYKDRAGLTAHMKTHQERERTELCHLCGKSFYDIHALKVHRNRMHKDEIAG